MTGEANPQHLTIPRSAPYEIPVYRAGQHRLKVRVCVWLSPTGPVELLTTYVGLRRGRSSKPNRCAKAKATSDWPWEST